MCDFMGVNTNHNILGGQQIVAPKTVRTKSLKNLCDDNHMKRMKIKKKQY